MQYLEYAGTILSLGYVLLLMFNKVWAWPCGILGSAIVAYTFIIPEEPLYMEAGSYIIYTILGIYGWYHWSKGKANKRVELPVAEWKWSTHIISIITTIAIALLAGFLMSNTNESNPYFDSLTTTFAMLGTWMQARKILSNWIYWFFINMASIVLYFINGFDSYAFLAIIFTVLSVSGFLKWKKIYNGQNL